MTTETAANEISTTDKFNTEQVLTITGAHFIHDTYSMLMYRDIFAWAPWIISIYNYLSVKIKKYLIFLIFF